MPSNIQRPRSNLGSFFNLIAFVLLSLSGVAGVYLLKHTNSMGSADIFGLFTIGIIGAFRWSLFFLRIARSRIFLHIVFPRWRRAANRIPADQFPHVCMIVPTYKEKPWITERVFRAIALEARALSQPITLVINSSSEQENAEIETILRAEDPELSHIHLVQMTQKQGKRKAMADSLRQVSQLGLPADSVVVLMDGDSELAPGALTKCLPFFRLFPKMGALTTDEMPIVNGSYLFSEWFHLRFAQRHYQMCSDSLSRKVMCLTGRFSIFKAEAALSPSFTNQLETDSLDDWLWGKFTFLSGDDKSTWYWLLTRGYDMLYIPDAMVYSIETISGSVATRAYQNMRRWYGNMLRNNGRAIALGPKITSWPIWFNLLDQRISIWTSLLTPGFLLTGLFQGNWLSIGIILSWITFTRPIMLMIVFLGRPSTLKPIHFPMLLFSQWSSSLIKIWTQMNMATQNWSNRGNQSISAEGSGTERLVKLSTSRFLLFSQSFSFVVFLCWLSGLLNPTWDLAGIWLSVDSSLNPSQVQMVKAVDYGIIASDGKDDAVALQVLMDQLSPQGDVEIQLPIGEIDLFQPVQIRRSNLALKGKGIARTVLQSHIQRAQAEAVVNRFAAAAAAANNDNETDPGSSALIAETIQVQNSQLENIRLSGFSVRHVVPYPQSGANYAVKGMVL